jgi:hypothetical protein
MDDLNLSPLVEPEDDDPNWWKFRDPPNRGKFDSIEAFLRGEMADASSESVLYLARLKNHSEYIKVGITQVRTRTLRMIDPEIGELIWESHQEDFLHVDRGNLTRAEAWIAEQIVLHEGQCSRQAIQILKESRWPGYTETFLAQTVKEEKALIDIAKASVNLIGLMGMHGFELGIKHLAISNEAKELYQARLEQILARISARANDRYVKAMASNDKQEIERCEKYLKRSEYYQENNSFTILYPE